MNFYDKYSEVYQRKTGYFDNLSATLKPLLSKENKSLVSVLDIGCGFGDFLGSLKNILKKQAKYHGLTLAKHEFSFIKKNKKFIDIKLGNQKKLLKIYKDKKKFDLIINFHTLSYIKQRDQLSVIQQMIKILKPDGLLVIGLIEKWIKKSDNCSHTGNGFVQFYYSPWMFREINNNCNLIAIINDNLYKYRTYVWQKKQNNTISLKGLVISLYHLIVGIIVR